MSKVRYPQLDERLQAAADLFTACETGADIGADHGRLSCYLLRENICNRMIVADISAASLSKARGLLERCGLASRAVFRVADGLFALDHPAQCIAVCGMGGRLMAGILRAGKEKLQGAALVLSCHTEIPLVRKAIVEIGYHLAAERLVRCGGRFYIIMRAEPGTNQYSEKEIYLGPLLMRDCPPLWQDYLQWRKGVVGCERGHQTQLGWIMEELANEATDGKSGTGLAE